MEDSRSIFLSPDERYDVWAVKSSERPYLLNVTFDANPYNVDSIIHPEDGAHADPSQLLTTCRQGTAKGTGAAEEKKVDVDDDSDTDDAQDQAMHQPQQKQQEHESIDNSDGNADEEEVLPLMDGCDIAGWRNQRLVPIDHSLQPTRASTIMATLNVGPGCALLRRESQLPCLSSRYLRNWKNLQQLFLEEPQTSRRAQRIPATIARALPANPWFECDNVPVILDGLAQDWNAMRTCRWEELVRRYGHCNWRFSDTHGICMTLATYDTYTNTMEGLMDDAPLAIYDSELVDEYDNEDEDGIDRRSLWDDYATPRCFSVDLFECLDVQSEGRSPDDGSVDAGDSSRGEDSNSNSDCNDGADDSDIDSVGDSDGEEGTQRPPYRWILMGPARSGTGLHVDPLGTHAWVTIVEGIKRWVLFPPTVDKEAIGMQEPQIPSAIWFASWYPKVMKRYGNVAIEVLQRPGETVYVPAGWPHLVLNLERTVALTENYATEFPTWQRLRDAVQREESDMFHVWIQHMRHQKPHLFAME